MRSTLDLQRAVHEPFGDAGREFRAVILGDDLQHHVEAADAARRGEAPAVDDIEVAPELDVRERLDERRLAGPVQGAGMAVEKAGPGQKERGVRHRADMGALAQALADPADRAVGHDVVGVAARAHDDTIDAWRGVDEEARLDDHAVRGFDLALGGADDDPAVALPFGEHVGRAQRLDDRAERHHGEAGENQDGKRGRRVFGQRLDGVALSHVHLPTQRLIVVCRFVQNGPLPACRQPITRFS